MADAFARGEHVPHGGERPEPNPQFLAHAAGLSELYVLLAAQAPTYGLRLRGFQREGDAREPFRADGRARALAPDALIDVEDEQGRQLLAFVELDGGYYGRSGNVSWFAAGACAMAPEPERAFAEACWDDLRLCGGGLRLVDCLNAARAPHDSAWARQQAEQVATEAERERLRSDPDARRALLQEKRLYARGEQLEQFGEPGATALQLLLHFSEPMSAVERDAFAALACQLTDDPLDAHLAPTPLPPSQSDSEAVGQLVAAYRARQQARVAELTRRYGEGPKLRRRRNQLAAGELISEFAWDALENDANHDQQARQEQERLRIAYLERREREERQRKHEAPLAARLVRGRAAAQALVDRDHLKHCRHCDEIVYPPEPSRDSYGLTIQPSYRQPLRCRFCGGHELDPWQERHLPQLQYGGNYRPIGGDLLSSGKDGLMDDPDGHKGGEW